MRSETKTIYGANVFGLVAMFHQLRRWWAIRELRSFWNQDRYCLGICKKFSHLAHHGLLNIALGFMFIVIAAGRKALQ